MKLFKRSKKKVTKDLWKETKKELSSKWGEKKFPKFDKSKPIYRQKQELEAKLRQKWLLFLQVL